jgi:hypothetical protein
MEDNTTQTQAESLETAAEAAAPTAGMAPPAPQEAATPAAEPAEDPAWQAIAREAAALREDYPTFDLETEMADPQFGMLLATLNGLGWPDALRTAYQAAHHEQIMASVLGYAVAQARSRMADSIRSGQARPAETGSGPAVTAGTDPTRMTARQIEDVRRRVLRGERVSF